MWIYIYIQKLNLNLKSKLVKDFCLIRNFLKKFCYFKFEFNFWRYIDIIKGILINSTDKISIWLIEGTNLSHILNLGNMKSTMYKLNKRSKHKVYLWCCTLSFSFRIGSMNLNFLSNF